MAYFSNGSEGMILDEQCMSCVFGEEACPIALAHAVFNYDQCRNDKLRKCLTMLVNDKGICVFREMMIFRGLFDPNQLRLDL